MPGGRLDHAPLILKPSSCAAPAVSSDHSLLYQRILMLFADLAPARAELLDMSK